MTEARLSDFLAYVQGQKEAALVAVSSRKELSDVEREFIAAGFTRADAPMQVLKHLRDGKSVIVLLAHPLQKDWYDIVAQYSERGGMVQLMNRDTMEFEVAQFDPRKTHLVFVLASDDLAKMEADGYMIRDKVGLVEQV